MKKLKIGVDLTPIVPGGANGGAKWATIDLLNGLARRGMRLYGFCQPSVLAELRDLLEPSIKLTAVPAGKDLQSLVSREDEQAGPFDLSFFPFSMISFRIRNVPAVPILHDIQFRELPQNFQPADWQERERVLQSCLAHADRIITISNFVRGSIVRQSRFPKNRIDVIYHRLPEGEEFGLPDESVLREYGLEQNEYFIYPANFWEHKNHRTLLAAYMLYLKNTPRALKLVFTGDLVSPLGKELKQLSAGLGGGNVIVTGFISPEHLYSLMGGARAMVFPSQYEGFGIPLIEAMALRVPIAASWTTCIPEVTGNAALLFDPYQPRKICEALLRIMGEEDLRTRLIAAGSERLAAIGDQRQMIDQYLQAFDHAVSSPRPYRDGVAEVSEDGWMGARATFSVGRRDAEQRLEARIEVPIFAPSDQIDVEVASSTTGRHMFQLRKGKPYLLSENFPATGGHLIVRPAWTFVPKVDLKDTDDHRTLSLRCENVTVTSGRQWATLLGEKSDEEKLGSAAAVVILAGTAAGNVGRVVIGSVGGPVPAAVSVELTGFVSLERASVPDCVTMPEFSVSRGDGTDNAWNIAVPHLAKGEILVLRGEAAGNVSFGGAVALTNSGSLDVLKSRSRAVTAPAVIRPVRGDSAAGFSVVTPSYNQGEYIRRTIESVLVQDRIVDYHIFDACSTDSTAAQVAPFDDRLTFVSESDGGQADAVNKGIAAGKGDYIAWINSDDTYHPEAFKRVGQIFDEEPDVGVVYGDAFHIDNDDQVIDRYPTEDFRLTRLLETCFVCQPATFFRRDILERFGGLRADLQYCMDYELWLRLSMAGVKFRRIDAVLANSRLYDTNKTAGARLNVHREVNDMMTQCFAVCPDKWLKAFSRILIEESLQDVPEALAGSMEADIRYIADMFWRYGLASPHEAAAVEDAGVGASQRQTSTFSQKAIALVRRQLSRGLLLRRVQAS